LTMFEDEALADPTNASRATLMGDIHPVPDADLAEARAAYLAKHPEAEQWVDFGDFTILRMEVKDLYFIGGFGSMGWILAEDYRQA
jgi:hypothetical protein